MSVNTLISWCHPSRDKTILYCTCLPYIRMTHFCLYGRQSLFAKQQTRQVLRELLCLFVLTCPINYCVAAAIQPLVNILNMRQYIMSHIVTVQMWQNENMKLCDSITCFGYCLQSWIDVIYHKTKTFLKISPLKMNLRKGFSPVSLVSGLFT